MSKIKKFEDLIAWQKARSLTQAVYQVTSKGKFLRDFGLTDQMRRAVVSVMSNIAEGFERGSASEFHRFLFIAKGSCAELRALFYVSFDNSYLTQGDFKLVMTQAEEVSRILGGLRASVEKRKGLI